MDRGLCSLVEVLRLQYVGAMQCMGWLLLLCSDMAGLLEPPSETYDVSCTYCRTFILVVPRCPSFVREVAVFSLAPLRAFQEADCSSRPHASVFMIRCVLEGAVVVDNHLSARSYHIPGTRYHTESRSSPSPQPLSFSPTLQHTS